MTKADILFSDFNKKYKTELFTKGKVIQKCARIPFSSPMANFPLYGGLPRGRLVEFSGAEASGKTTTCLDIVGNAQKLFQKEWKDELEALESLAKPNKEQIARIHELRDCGPKKCLYVDAENTFDEEWAEKMGVDVDALDFMSPQEQPAEEIFEMILQLLETGEFGLVVIDSLGVMMSQQAYEKTVMEKTYGGIAMALTNFSKKATGLCAKTNCLLIGINQMRDNMNSMYGGTTTTGGKAWKHNCSVRIECRKFDHFDEKYAKVAKTTCEEPFGHYVQIHIEKTKVSKNNRKLGQYCLEYENGINAMMDYINLAIKPHIGIIKQSGAWFTFMDKATGEILCDEEGSPYKVQGLKNIPTFLKEHEDIYEMIKTTVDKIIVGEDIAPVGDRDLDLHLAPDAED